MNVIVGIAVWIGLGYLLNSVLGVQMGYLISAVIGTLVVVGLGTQEAESAS